MRSGLITLDQLQEVALFADHHHHALLDFPELAAPSHQRRLLFEVIRRMLSAQVYDLIGVSQAALAAALPTSPDQVRNAGPLLAFGEATRANAIQLKQFLFRNLYRHPQVQQTTGVAKQVVRELFDAYMSGPQELPGNFGTTMGAARLHQGLSSHARVVADYIAGMTDRFASREHARLTGQRLLV